MSNSATDICNLALGRVRATEIDDLDSENSPSAIACRRLYAGRRDALLTSYSWRFAKVTRELSLKVDVPAEWAYMYDYPNDCLRVHYIIPYVNTQSVVTAYGIATERPLLNPIPYEVAAGDDGSRRILTNLAEAHISYTKRVEEVSLFDPLFYEGLAWFLAIDLAIPLGGDSGKKYRDDAREEFRMAITQAQAHSSNESEPGRARVPRTLQVRHGYSRRDYDRPL